MRLISNVTLVLVAVLSVGTITRAQTEPRPTPPQKFFDWTELDFAPEEYVRRRAALVERLAASGGGVFLTPSVEGTSDGGTFRQSDDFLYFTGLELPGSILAIDADSGRSTLFAPSNDRRFHNPSRRNDFPGRRLGADPELIERTGIAAIRPPAELAAALAQWASSGRTVRLRGARSGPLDAPADPAPLEREDAVRTLHRFILRAQPELSLANAFAAVATLRMVKSPPEIAVIRRACAITADGIRRTATRIVDGIDERTLEGVLEAAFKERGAQRIPFASIVKSGPNSLWPWRILAAHYDRRNRSMHRGDLVIFDVGCELDHYASDVGRTFPVSGRFTAAQRERLEMATRVADAIIAAVKPGVTFAELREVAYTAIPTAERRYMQTGLFFGHHTGLAVGDPALAGVPLAPGMVFTVEPWYYNHDAGIAVFVEDEVLVTETGAENLTAGLPRTADELERLVGPRTSLRVLSYNIKHGRGNDGRVDLLRAAAVIDALRPDVVALQEVDIGCGRSGTVDEAAELGRMTGMFPMFGKFMDYDGGEYGMALLSRHPVERYEVHRLPEDAEPRATVAATIRVAGTDRRFVLAGIHLYRSEETRLAQARRLVEVLGESEHPTLLVGDFNSRPGSPVLEVLSEHWRPAGKDGDRLTFSSDRPRIEIDFVMLPVGGPFRSLECRVIDDPVTSDHRPVFAVLEFDQWPRTERK